MDERLATSARSHRYGSRHHRLAKAALSGLFLVTASLGISNVSGATSTRCAFYDKVALFCARTTGKGTYVDQVFASYGSGGPIGILDNVKLEVQFVNTNGNAYATYFSKLQRGKKSSGGWKWILAKRMKIGLVRYTLLSDGAVIASIQEDIT
jgi:hypothetical protein